MGLVYHIQSIIKLLKKYLISKHTTSANYVKEKVNNAWWEPPFLKFKQYTSMRQINKMRFNINVTYKKKIKVKQDNSWNPLKQKSKTPQFLLTRTEHI